MPEHNPEAGDGWVLIDPKRHTQLDIRALASECQDVKNYK